MPRKTSGASNAKPRAAKSTSARTAKPASLQTKPSAVTRKAASTTPDAYFAALPAERRPVMLALRAAIAKALPKGFEEIVAYGMPGWVVPLTAYPAGYHCTPGAPLPFLGLASQKSHISFYHMGLYTDPALLALGGSLMGLANLVPGISGGTMLVAAGVYHRFIEAISELSRLRFRAPTLLTLAAVVGPALCSIALFATLVSQALVEMRWVMYSLFIGLTFGGVPVLWKVLRPANTAAWIGAVAGAGGMIAITWLQSDAVSNEGMTGAWMLLLGGAAGAAAMILPGISGAYLLMLLGQYRPILEAIRAGAAALAAGDLEGVWSTGVFLLPVAAGVGLGLVAASNVLRWLLRRFEKATLGVLLGLLIGAPAGLYPFKEGVPPRAGETFRGEVLDAAAAEKLLDRPKDWPEKAFTPSPVQVAGSLAVVAIGFAATLGVARLGRGKPGG